MRQGKFKILFVALLVALGLLFAGGDARAAVLSYTLDPNVVVTNTKTLAKYTYTFTINPASLSVGYVNFAIPVGICVKEGIYSGNGAPGCTPLPGNPTLTGTPGYSNTGDFTVTATGATVTGGEVFCPGCGDFGSKFGYGDTRVRVLKANILNPSSSFQLTLSLDNQNFGGVSGVPYIFGTDPGGALLIKAGQGTNTQTFWTMTPSVVASSTPVVIIDSLYPDNFVMTKLNGMMPNAIKDDAGNTCANLVWHSDGRPTTFAVTASNGGTIGTTIQSGDSYSAKVCPPVPPPPTTGTVATPVETIYTVTATGSDGLNTTATDTARLTVLPLTEAAVLSLTLDNYSIYPDYPANCPTLTWTTENASHAFISNITKNGGLVEQAKVASGSLRLEGEDCPLFNTTYTLTSIGWNGTIATTSVILEVKGDLRLPSSPPEGTPLNFQGNLFRVIRDKFEKVIDVLVCGDLDYNASTAGEATGPCTGPQDNRCCSLHMEPSKLDTDLRTCMSISGSVECILDNFTHSPHNLRYTGTGLTDAYSTCIEGMEARFNWGTANANCCYITSPRGCTTEKRGAYTYCTNACTRVHSGPGH